MNILLIYPQYPDTFWSFKHALRFISKSASNIPLGLVTVASLLPSEWNKKLIDLNVSDLRDTDLTWADYVMISAMSIQRASVEEVLMRCKEHSTKTIAGGPLFTEEFDQFPNINHLILNEAEVTFPLFLEDMKKGTLQRIYKSEFFADINQSPVPDYSLLKLSKYSTACIQYSRGCPYDCEFCDITALLGHKVRTKDSPKIIKELDNIYMSGWRGPVFFVDDNFIGHRQKLKNELLPMIIEWMRIHDYPFNFITEASVNLADDQELMRMMVNSGFTKVFVGIETIEANSLLECNKVQNNKRDLMMTVELMQKNGLEVAGGFIVGFDNDPPEIFQRLSDFIQESGIITAMVGLLNAPRLSKLYSRLSKEGRITSSFSGDNTDYSINFIPAMDKEELLKGYQSIISHIYSSRNYYIRVLNFLRKYDPPMFLKTRLTLSRIWAFLRSILYLGILKKDRKYYWNLLFWCIRNKPSSFPLAVTYSIYGYHFRKVFRGVN